MGLVDAIKNRSTIPVLFPLQDRCFLEMLGLQNLNPLIPLLKAVVQGRGKSSCSTDIPLL